MSNALTTPTPAAVAEAQAVLARHQAATSQPAGPGGHAAAVASSPEMRALDAEIDAITALAHTGKLTDSSVYEARQGELLELVERRTALARGAAPAARTAVAAARGGSPVPASVEGYPDLPDVGQSPEVYQQDATVWARQLPKMLKLGISYEQARGLSVIAREAEADSFAIQDDHRAAVHAQSTRELQRRYGPNFHADIKKANEFVRTLLPNGGSRQLCGLRLADGSTLGDNPLFVRMLIEFAREAL